MRDLSRRRQRFQVRKELRRRDGDCCVWCGEPMLFGLPYASESGASIEHLVPRKLGGTDDIDNLALAHFGCNHQRNHRDTILRNETRRLAYLFVLLLTSEGGCNA
jgi:5-methylcytosine-specific restriction endonuclease McrA